MFGSKEKKEVVRRAIKEAEAIFMKNNRKKYSNFPAVDETNMDTDYGKEARRVEDQVVKTRLANWRKK